MKLSLFDDYRLGVWGRAETIVDVTGLIDPAVRPADRMTALIERWEELAPELASAPDIVGTPLAEVRLKAPQPRPTKIVAAPANHAAHGQEMAVAETIETWVGFLKAPSSVVGPDGAIELPQADRRIDHEGELGIVIGRTAKGVSRAEALGYVFGYVPLLDITIRGAEDRSYRKSFDTFTPMGPAIVTADEIADPDALDIRLTVNGELRQQGSTAELIYGVARLIETYSAAMTLEPGDVVASGTVDGVAPIAPGDELTLTITRLPSLRMAVRGGTHGAR